MAIGHKIRFLRKKTYEAREFIKEDLIQDRELDPAAKPGNHLFAVQSAGLHRSAG
jgi:hypothetical protein